MKNIRKILSLILSVAFIFTLVACGNNEPSDENTNEGGTTVDNKVKIEYKTVNGLEFKVRTAGLENEGDMIVFLHGFPESSIIWEDVMERLGEKGFRCIAPDQRGYSAGARPVGVENYTYDNLCGDVVALAEAFGNDGKFHLVGHDWGASVTWVTSQLYPDKIKSLTALSTPHTQAYLWAFENDPEQIAATGYIRNYQTPGFEEYFAANDFALLRNAWTGFPQENIDDYLTIFSVPEARTATINWYRTMFLPTGPDNPEIVLGDINVPTLYIWGSDDAYLKKAGVNMTHPYMTDYYKFVQIKGAGHWLMEFNNAEVSKEIIEHIIMNSEE